MPAVIQETISIRPSPLVEESGPSTSTQMPVGLPEVSGTPMGLPFGEATTIHDVFPLTRPGEDGRRPSPLTGGTFVEPPPLTIKVKPGRPGTESEIVPLEESDGEGADKSKSQSTISPVGEFLVSTVTGESAVVFVNSVRSENLIDPDEFQTNDSGLGITEEELVFGEDGNLLGTETGVEISISPEEG